MVSGVMDVTSSGCRDWAEWPKSPGAEEGVQRKWKEKKGEKEHS